MTIEKDVKELAKKFTKYRKLQARRVKLMNQAMNTPEKKASKVDYKKKVFALLAEINALLKEMDLISDRILACGSREKKIKAAIDLASKGPGNKQNLIN